MNTDVYGLIFISNIYGKDIEINLFDVAAFSNSRELKKNESVGFNISYNNRGYSKLIIPVISSYSDGSLYRASISGSGNSFRYTPTANSKVMEITF